MSHENQDILYEDSHEAAVKRVQALIEGQRPEQFIPISCVRAALRGDGDE